MPKPLLLARSAGLFVRFLVPADLRAQVGSRFIVRSLRGLRGDQARLAAAVLGMALSQAFEALRRGGDVVDIKKILDDAQRAASSGSIREWTATGVQIGRVNLGTVQVNGEQDTRDFVDTVRALLSHPDNQVDVAAIGQLRAEERAPPAQPEPAPEHLLQDEIDGHLADLERRRLQPDTITESKHALRIFAGLAGNIPVRSIKATHVRVFLDGIRWWPERATVRPQYRGMSVLEIIEAGKRENVPPPSPHTFNKHIQRLGVFFNSLVALDLMSKNPIKAIRPEIDTSTDLDTGRAFTQDELNKIFEPTSFVPWATKYPHRWWGPILGLYSGARVNEIGQLFVEDVRQIDGVWGMFLWKNARTQKIKNRASIRFVPLAQAVLDAGFLAFVEAQRAAGQERLFPDLPPGTRKDGTPNGKGYGKQLSKQFAAYTKKLGIEKGVAFHSFGNPPAFSGQQKWS
ncbi:MAG: DUF6538 domain-containing protein [Pseudomonadota bacterium]